MPQQSVPESDGLSSMDASESSQSACKTWLQTLTGDYQHLSFYVPSWEFILNSRSQNREEKGDGQTHLTEKQVERKPKTSLVFPASQGRAGTRYTARSPKPSLGISQGPPPGTSSHSSASPAPALCYHFEEKKKRNQKQRNLWVPTVNSY